MENLFLEIFDQDFTLGHPLRPFLGDPILLRPKFVGPIFLLRQFLGPKIFDGPHFVQHLFTPNLVEPNFFKHQFLGPTFLGPKHFYIKVCSVLRNIL